MDDSFHYLSMINHMTVQKKLMEQLADTCLLYTSLHVISAQNPMGYLRVIF